MKKEIASILNGLSEFSSLYIGLIILNRFGVLYIPDSFGSVITCFIITITFKSIADILNKK